MKKDKLIQSKEKPSFGGFGRPVLSYFRLLLLQQLNERYPSLAEDSVFIDNRCEWATQVYQDSIEQGFDVVAALELAQSELLEGIEFVANDLLMEIIEEEFLQTIPADKRDAVCQKLLSQAQSLCEQYNFVDENRFDSSFSLLYIELTRTVALYWEEHGVQ